MFGNGITVTNNLAVNQLSLGSLVCRWENIPESQIFRAAPEAPEQNQCGDPLVSLCQAL